LETVTCHTTRARFLARDGKAKASGFKAKAKDFKDFLVLRPRLRPNYILALTRLFERLEGHLACKNMLRHSPDSLETLDTIDEPMQTWKLAAKMVISVY